PREWHPRPRTPWRAACKPLPSCPRRRQDSRREVRPCETVAKPERRAGVFVRPARVERLLRVELVDEPVQSLGVNVQVDDCGAELTEQTARVPPLGPRLGETLQQPHDARALLRELGLDQLDPMRLCSTSDRLHSLLPETLARPV